MNNRESAYALTRITYGLIFLFYGIGKFRDGLSNFVGGMNQQLSGKLPAAMVMPFAYAIPFAETISGALIFVGLFYGSRFDDSIGTTTRRPDVRGGDPGSSSHRSAQPAIRITEFPAIVVH